MANELIITIFEVGSDVRGKMVLMRAGLLNSVLDLSQQVFHFSGPWLLILLVDECQFSEVVGIAQAMGELVIVEIGFPMVVNGCALKFR